MSRSNAEGDSLGPGLVIFETFSQHSKGEDLRFGHGVICRVAVRKNAGQLRYFRQPPAVIFAFALDLKVHGNAHFTPLFSRCLTILLNGRPLTPLRPGEHAIHCEHRAPTMIPSTFRRVVRRHGLVALETTLQTSILAKIEDKRSSRIRMWFFVR